MKNNDSPIEYYRNSLELEPHPEGGFFKETYRSSTVMSQGCLGSKFDGDRNTSTAIYFLLTADNFSAFHRIKQDEIWHFYAGDSLDVHIIHPSGEYELLKIGSNLSQGERFQGIVPAGAWFASNVAGNGQFSLVGCTVAPGFDFKDFELAEKEDLMKSFPQHQEIISKYCRA